MTCRWPRRLSPKRSSGSSSRLTDTLARYVGRQQSPPWRRRLSVGQEPNGRTRVLRRDSTWWAGRMLRTHDYFARAEQHLRLAEQARNCRRKALHLKLAQLYLSLVELRQKNAATDLTYETP